MSISKWQTTIFIFAITCICMMAWVLQTTLLFNNDVQWLMTAASRLIKGGTYARDFFEPNPPLILYLYIPPLLLMKYTSLSITLAVRIYIFALTLFSFGICQFFIKKIISKNDLFIANLFSIVLLIGFMIFPFGEFAQREHIIFVLSMPYLLCVAFRLQGNTPNYYLAAVVGLLGGIGFGIKPHFLVIPLLLELYFIINKRNIFACLRVESIAMLMFYVIYLGIIFVFHYDYIATVIPYTARLYYAGYGLAMADVIFNSPVIFCCIPALLCLSEYKQNPYKILTVVLQIAFLGFLFGYLVQHKKFYYQSLPLVSVSVLLMVMSLNLIRQPINFRKYTYLCFALCGILAFISIYTYNNIIWTKILFHSNQFYGYFGLILIILFYSLSEARNLILILSYVLAIIAFAFIFSIQTSYSSFYAHRFFLTITSIILLFSLYLPKSKNGRLHNIFITTFAIIFFAYPFEYIANNYFTYIQRKDTHIASSLSNFIKSHAQNKTVYFFWTVPCPFPELKTLTYGARFPFFWMLPGLAIKDQLQMTSSNKNQQLLDKNLFISMVVDDLTIRHPDFVFIDDKIEKPYPQRIKFDYLAFFSQESKFKEVWKNYHYLTTLEGPKSKYQVEPIFKLKVYERSTSLASR